VCVPKPVSQEQRHWKVQQRLYSKNGATVVVVQMGWTIYVALSVVARDLAVFYRSLSE